MINIIVAYNSNRVIGNNGQIPWKIPEDIKRFKKLTWGGKVIMGRKTWDSLPSQFKPLPNRTNIVVTRQNNWHEDGCSIFSSLDSAFDYAKELSTDPVWVIGGAEIYNQTLQKGIVDKIYATEVVDDSAGDAFFPKINYDDWDIDIELFGKYNFVTYTKTQI